MKPANRALAMNGLKFSGTVTAAFSHDFKNALAIIKENTGLLKDLVAMADGGRPLDPQRLAVLADRIGRQVERADRMTVQLNRFAHCADAPDIEADLAAMLELAAVLASRPANLKRVVLEVVPTTAPHWVTTFPFALQQLLYRCIEPLLERAGSGGRIVLEVGGGKDLAAVDLIARTADDQIPAGGQTPPPSPEMTELAGALNIRLEWNGSAGGWRLVWHAGRAAATVG